MDRSAQHDLLAWTLDAIDGSVAAPPPLEAARLRPALLTTGLVALVGVLAEQHGISFDRAITEHLREQRRAVEARHRRYLGLAPRLFEALDTAGVAATPVKGIVLTSVGMWPVPTARPMADIDLLVPAEHRERCAPVLESIGLHRVEQTGTEDVYLAWGDGAAGRTDGESVHHNGKVEIHPGWVEHLHGYEIGHAGLLDRTERRRLLGAPARLLPDPWLVAHVIGHLSACVIRRDVRAVNVLDVVFALRWLSPTDHRMLAEVLGQLDPRLVVPALWLVHGYASDDVERAGLRADLAQLPRAAAAQLREARPADALRDGSTRSPWAWRGAFTGTLTERAAAAKELVLPPAHQVRRADPSASLVALYGRRVRRAVSRLAPRPATR